MELNDKYLFVAACWRIICTPSYNDDDDSSEGTDDLSEGTISKTSALGNLLFSSTSLKLYIKKLLQNISQLSDILHFQLKYTAVSTNAWSCILY